MRSSDILLETGTNELELLEFTINGNLYGINIAELSTDRTFKNSEGKDVSRFGGGGIDGITVGKLPGGGYILPAGYTLKEDITAADGTVYKKGTVLSIKGMDRVCSLLQPVNAPSPI